ncbi:MAG: hypothetical protein IPM53_09440 [Anaerolineaceae bacterium]|nr:hypothetical protein [Anaerolineaceae bacterium]
MKKLCWLILLVLLVACGRDSASPATAVPPTAVPPTAARTETMVLPTDTAVPAQPTNTIPPAPQPRPTRPPVNIPTATPTEVADEAIPEAADVPELVWLPFAAGSFGEPVLMVEDGEIARQDLPVAVEIFFDYHDGWLAYGSYFWEATADQKSVTDLHLYNLATGEDAVWAEQVGRAAISPLEMLEGPPSVAAAIHNGQSFDLVLIRGPENRTVLVEDIDPYFSWSPDASQIAYVHNNELFVTEAAADSGNPSIASGVYVTTGWIGDAPLWLGDSGYLLYADAPFTIVAVDGSETIVPTAEDGTSLAALRPLTMLYSATNNQLIAEVEGMFGADVVVYQFGEGFETAVITQQINDAQLAGWYEEGESVIIVSGGEPGILSLTPQE